MLRQSHRIQVKLTLMSVTRGSAADFLMMSQAENVALGKLVLEENFYVFNLIDFRIMF